MTPPAPVEAASRSLVVLGASVRSFAQSAHLAGWRVHAADLFCDLDLRAVSTDAVSVAADYPRGLAVAAARFPASAPWVYTGGLENHPALIETIASSRPLAGNSAAVVTRMRDPDLIAGPIAAAGLTFPQTRRRSDGLPVDGSYLIKPLASAGGRGIRPWTHDTAAARPARTDGTDRSAHVWQRFVPGVPLSAAYVFAAGESRLIGLTRQLVGETWCRAGRFAWCGGVTVGRADLLPHFERLGDALAAAFRPTGAIGVDAILDADGGVSVLEINPRPTASMELFERSTGISIAATHLSAFGHAPHPLPTSAWPPHSSDGRWAKAVLYTVFPVPITRRLVESLDRLAAAWTLDDGGHLPLADIPAHGQTLDAAAPFCTIFARGRNSDEALERLRDRVTAAAAMLDASAPGAIAPRTPQA